jgi:hypothetical protein
VHDEWFPEFANVQQIIDVRVRLDLVIIADRGGQTFTPPPPHAGKVTSHVNGWFEHGDTHEPAYWNGTDSRPCCRPGSSLGAWAPQHPSDSSPWAPPGGSRESRPLVTPS